MPSADRCHEFSLWEGEEWHFIKPRQWHFYLHQKESMQAGITEETGEEVEEAGLQEHTHVEENQELTNIVESLVANGGASATLLVERFQKVVRPTSALAFALLYSRRVNIPPPHFTSRRTMTAILVSPTCMASFHQQESYLRSN